MSCCLAVCASWGVRADAEDLTLGDLTLGDLTLGDLTLGDLTLGDLTLGEWRTPAKVTVQVLRCAKSVCARIVRVPDDARNDVNNPDPHLRARPVLGIQIFSATRRYRANGWKGQIYMPETGYSYAARLSSLERNRLQVDICGPMGFFCSQEVWVRTR